MAKTQAILFGGTENYLVTREFNRLATREEKLALLRCLFAVSASDDSISVMEDNEIRRIADELRLTHEDFIAARSEFRKYLSVLRKTPGGRPLGFCPATEGRRLCGRRRGGRLRHRHGMNLYLQAFVFVLIRSISEESKPR